MENNNKNVNNQLNNVQNAPDFENKSAASEPQKVKLPPLSFSDLSQSDVLQNAQPTADATPQPAVNTGSANTTPPVSATAPVMYNQPYVNMGPTAEQIERNTLRRRANALGLGFCLTIAVSMLLFPIITLVLAIAGVNASGLISALDNPFYAMVYQIVFSMVAFVPTFIIASKVARVKLNKIIPFGKAKKGTTLPFLLIGFGFLAVANVLANIFSNILRVLGISDFNFEMETPTGVSGFIITVIAAAVVPALVEEFAYRGVFIGLTKEYGEGFCIVASSLMFGLMHGNLEQIPFAFIVGLVLGFVRIKSGSIIPAMLLHFINNFVSVILSTLLDGAPQLMVIFANVVYYAVAALCMVLGILMLKGNSYELFKIEKSDSALTSSQKNSAFYAAPLTIVAFVLTFLQIISSELV